MHTDPIADLLTRIRNAMNAQKDELTVPHSKIKENVLKVLKEKKFIKDYAVTEEGGFKVLTIELDENRTKMTLRRVSSPGQRIYIKSKDLKPVKSGLGIKILSTSKGVMTNLEAKRENLGGELLCEIY